MKQLLKLCVVFSFLLMGIDAIGQYDDLYFDDADREKINESQRQKKTKKYKKKNYDYSDPYKEPRAGIDEQPIYQQWKDSLNIIEPKDRNQYSLYSI